MRIIVCVIIHINLQNSKSCLLYINRTTKLRFYVKILLASDALHPQIILIAELFFGNVHKL